MTFLDPASPAASAGLEPAVEDVETSAGELVGIGFEREALDRNYWAARQRRTGHTQFSIISDISEALYGDRNAWRGAPEDGSEAPAVDDQINTLFRDLEVRREVDPGRLANFPQSPSELAGLAQGQVQEEMQAERNELDLRAANRSSPNLVGGVAEFVGMASAAVSDVEGLATLPLGAGSGSLGRTVLIESAIGAGSEAITIPAYNAQARFLDREAPDPLQLLLFGATFGAALPLAGRGLKEGARLTTKGAEITNRQLLAAARKRTGSDAARGAAAQLARDEAALDSAPAGVVPEQHAADLDAAEVALEGGDPVIVRPDDIDAGPQGQPIAARLMVDLQAELGLAPYQAAGIVGNLAHESGGFRNLQEIAPLVPGSRGGFGYAQWTGPRRRAFEAWSIEHGLDPRSYEANLGFLLHELRNTNESAVLNDLRGAQTAAEATQIFSDRFLRPGIPHMDSRFTWTERALGGDIGTLQGPLRNREGTLQAVFERVSLKADNDGFTIEAGEVSFTQRWAAEFDNSAPDVAGERLADLRRQRDEAAGLREDILVAANAEIRRTEQQIERAIAGLQERLKSTQGKNEKAKVRAQIKEAHADLAEVRDAPEITETPETKVLREQVEGFATEIAELRRTAPDLPEPSSRAAGSSGAPAPGGEPENWRVSPARAESYFRQLGGDPAELSGTMDEIVEAVEQRAAAVRAAAPTGAAGPLTNQPPEGAATRPPEMFDDPVASAGSVAQIDLLEADIRARLEANPDADAEMPIGIDTDASTVRMSDVLTDHDEEADFLDQLKICMPKGVSNG